MTLTPRQQQGYLVSKKTLAEPLLVFLQNFSGRRAIAPLAAVLPCYLPSPVPYAPTRRFRPYHPLHLSHNSPLHYQRSVRIPHTASLHGPLLIGIRGILVGFSTSLPTLLCSDYGEYPAAIRDFPPLLTGRTRIRT